MKRLVKRVPDPHTEKGNQDLSRVTLVHSESRHLYAKMGLYISNYVSTLQLKRVHHQFVHSSTDKLFKLLSRATPDDAIPETSRISDNISSQRDICQ